jgi:hypothetical protein
MKALVGLTGEAAKVLFARKLPESTEYGVEDPDDPEAIASMVLRGLVKCWATYKIQTLTDKTKRKTMRFVVKHHLATEAPPLCKVARDRIARKSRALGLQPPSCKNCWDYVTVEETLDAQLRERGLDMDVERRSGERVRRILADSPYYDERQFINDDSDDLGWRTERLWQVVADLLLDGCDWY